MTNRETDSEVYAVVAEFKGEGPILMETGGVASSHESARERMNSLMARPDCIRAAVVQIMPTRFGNELLLTDMKRMQK